MKQFDIRKDISGSRMVIYPGGALAKAAQHPRHYFDSPYIDVRNIASLSYPYDTAELVVNGHVQKRLYLWANDPLGGQCKQLVNLMKEL